MRSVLGDIGKTSFHGGKDTPRALLCQEGFDFRKFDSK
jgi:hypothetical protein